MGWWWAVRGTQGRIPSTHNSTFLSTWPCQSPRSPYRMCSYTDMSPPPHTFPSVTCLLTSLSTPPCLLIRDPLAEVSTHIPLGHTVLSRSLTLHLWPPAERHDAHVCADTLFSQEHTHTNLCFPWESWLLGNIYMSKDRTSATNHTCCCNRVFSCFMACLQCGADFTKYGTSVWQSIKFYNLWT